MTLDPSYRSVIQGIVNSAPMNSRRENLPVGTHEVAICRYQAVAGMNNSGYRLESTWLILSSDQPTVTQGTIRDWSWFPQAQGFRGQYESDRAHSLLSLGREGLGSNDTDDQFGDKLATGEYRGMRWRVTVVQVYNDDGSIKMSRPKGNNAKPKPIRNAEFFPVKQTLGDLQQMKAYLETNFASACKNAEPRQQQPGYAGGGQFQQAPHPAQMPGQYPAQPSQPQQHGYAPQYNQQPVPVQPQQAPQQYPSYPQQPVQGAPMNPTFTQPQYAQPQQQQAPWAQPAQAPAPQQYPQQPAQPQFQTPQMPTNTMPVPQGPQAMPQFGGAPAPVQTGSPFGAAPALSALGPMMNQLRQQ
jgi:hypothetical protein